VEGWAPANASTVLYGDGGMAKSLQALLIGECVARGQQLFGRQVQQGRVLYLDWELDREEQTRRAHRVAAGLGYPAPAPGLYYHQMASPLSAALPRIREWVDELQITLVVIDSFGLASLGDPTTARDVVPLLAGVSKLPCTCLFIDHVRNLQPGETGDDLKPFGSVYKFNIARSVIRVARAGGDEVSLSLLVRQTKSNFGPLSEPLGLRVTFEEERICFEQVATSSPGFARAARRRAGLEKVAQALSRLGEASPQQLAEATELSVGTVKNKLTELRRGGLAAPIARGLWRPLEPSSSPSLPLSSSDDDDVAAAGGQ
jgi:DNA-binding transcriptional ArsR family regulator